MITLLREKRYIVTVLAAASTTFWCRYFNRCFDTFIPNRTNLYGLAYYSVLIPLPSLNVSNKVMVVHTSLPMLPSSTYLKLMIHQSPSISLPSMPTQSTTFPSSTRQKVGGSASVVHLCWHLSPQENRRDRSRW